MIAYGTIKLSCHCTASMSAGFTFLALIATGELHCWCISKGMLQGDGSCKHIHTWFLLYFVVRNTKLGNHVISSQAIPMAAGSSIFSHCNLPKTLKLHISWGIFMSWRQRRLICLFYLSPFVPQCESQLPPMVGTLRKSWTCGTASISATCCQLPCPVLPISMYITKSAINTVTTFCPCTWPWPNDCRYLATLYP
jgi:hypothetical protein